MDPRESNGWSEHRLLVIKGISNLEADIKEIKADIQAIRSELNMLRFKVSMMGAGAGALPVAAYAAFNALMGGG